ncbi:MAG: FKBP-type peptidyl-prolyl cis-trans isomerase [Candidatus Eisenbacteria bacterium]|nr:FKBP-type peptidyl-prolyl cis-trans isomerase [Candidatus Eisenbacteria bacterium]
MTESRRSRLRFVIGPLACLAIAALIAGCGNSKTGAGRQAEQGKSAPAASAEAQSSAPSSPAPSTMDQKEAAPVSDEKVVTTASGLKYVDMVAGEGASPARGQRVVVHYTGWLADGKKFDSSLDRGQPFKFMLGQGQVIKGWDEGVATMKVGGKRKLIIPHQLAYGERGYRGAIPPKAELTFEVQLLSIE